MAEAHAGLTKNQTLVLEALDGAGAPRTAYAILDELRGSGLRAPLQVYRALDKLVDYGLVHRLESLNAFVACRHKGCAAHDTAAFAICETCGNVVEFSPDEAIAALRAWTGEKGFRLNRTTIELRGECRECNQSA